MKSIDEILGNARKAADILCTSETSKRNSALIEIAGLLRKHSAHLIAENAIDVQQAKEVGKSDAIIDRLALSSERIESMALALEEIVALPDPLGELYDMNTRPNGLRVGRMRIPLGVIGIIFESRPNVIADAGALCLKSGNAVILRGGSEAAHSNAAIGDVIEEALETTGLPRSAIQVVRDTDRKLVLDMLTARGKLDLLIPRGGEGLIRFVDEHARVPLVLHYKGVCHVYIDTDADMQKGVDIIVNAKAQRPGVCNAAETLLVHRDIAAEFLPLAAAALKESGVSMRGCERSRKYVPEMDRATKEDWDAEYLDLILAVRIVDDLDQALEHIRLHGSGHTESIVSENYSTAGKFISAIQSSCVAVNASTRFNDGGELGLGAEIGISTTKLHAYGPMGLKELTASKFVVLGNGQVR